MADELLAFIMTLDVDQGDMQMIKDLIATVPFVTALEFQVGSDVYDYLTIYCTKKDDVWTVKVVGTDIDAEPSYDGVYHGGIYHTEVEPEEDEDDVEVDVQQLCKLLNACSC
jgi:hypothetical protein